MKAKVSASILSLLVFGSAALFLGCNPQSRTQSGNSDEQAVRTLRVDYNHTGAFGSESFELDDIIEEGIWPGNQGGSIDALGYGEYFFEVRSAISDQLLYSLGFASIFGEWQSTAEAKSTEKTFHESLRFPMPEEVVNLVIQRRQPDMSFREVWSTSIDPAEVLSTSPDPNFLVWAVIENGPPTEKVDLLLLGDGYTADEMEKWHADANRLAETLFAYSPFKERRSEFNVWAIDTPAGESGISRPSADVERDSPIGATYDAFGSERYVLTFDNKKWRDIAAAAPYEFVEIVVNERKYGGGGIYNLFATVASDNSFTPYVFVHEFGHHFAGLADEYYTSDVSYEATEERVEPWGPNATANPLSPKWADLIADKTPLPTPWPKHEFEAFQVENQARRRELRASGAPESEVEALFRHEEAVTTALLGESTYSHDVGAFEGAYYQANGYYRSQADCIMFTRNDVGFCAACTRAINRMIDRYSNSTSD